MRIWISYMGGVILSHMIRDDWWVKTELNQHGNKPLAWRPHSSPNMGPKKCYWQGVLLPGPFCVVGKQGIKDVRKTMMPTKTGFWHDSREANHNFRVPKAHQWRVFEVTPGRTVPLRIWVHQRHLDNASCRYMQIRFFVMYVLLSSVLSYHLFLCVSMFCYWLRPYLYMSKAADWNLLKHKCLMSTSSGP